MNHKITLSVLFLKESDKWVGQCLERDIAAQGRTFAAAKAALEKTLAGQIFLDDEHGKEPFSGIRPAPEFYREKFDSAEQLKTQLHIHVTDEITPVETEDVRVALA